MKKIVVSLNKNAEGRLTSRTKTVDLTSEEIAQRLKEEADHEKEKPKREALEGRQRELPKDKELLNALWEKEARGNDALIKSLEERIQQVLKKYPLPEGE